MGAVPEQALKNKLIVTEISDVFSKGCWSDLVDNIDRFVDYYWAKKRNVDLKMLHYELTNKAM